jgi:hypothetical protein
VKRTFGMVFMVVGGIGLVVSLLLVPAIWIGRSYAYDQISALAGGVGGPVVQVEESAGELRGRVDALRNRIREVGQQVTTVADRGTIDQQAAARLVALLDSTLGDEYARLREAYVSMRERLRSLAETRDRMQRLLPGFSIPLPPSDELAIIDQGLQAMDSAMRQMRANLAEGTLPGTTLLRQVAAGLEQLDQRLGALVAGFDRISARLDQVQVALDNAEARLQTYVTIAAIVFTLLFLYGALLHAALIAAGRSWWRPEASVSTAAEPELSAQASSASIQ